MSDLNAHQVKAGVAPDAFVAPPSELRGSARPWRQRGPSEAGKQQALNSKHLLSSRPSPLPRVPGRVRESVPRRSLRGGSQLGAAGFAGTGGSCSSAAPSAPAAGLPAGGNVSRGLNASSAVGAARFCSVGPWNRVSVVRLCVIAPHGRPGDRGLPAEFMVSLSQSWGPTPSSLKPPSGLASHDAFSRACRKFPEPWTGQAPVDCSALAFRQGR